jgi:putative ABC transport system permease protein
MIRFLVKGLLRDRSRSLFPLLTVLFGAMLTVVLYSWIKGLEAELVRVNAIFSTGHIKMTTRAYAEEAEQVANDLALFSADSLLEDLNRAYPQLVWTPRIRFGGLLDIPDSTNETRAQAPVVGLAVDLFSASSPERRILNLERALMRGRLPNRAGELLVSDVLAARLGITPGEWGTLIGSTMYGSLATANFTIVGTVRFGIGAMDRGAVIADIGDTQAMLDMHDAAGELVGYFRDGQYSDDVANSIVKAFGRGWPATGEFAPVMVTLRNQGGLAQTLDYAGSAAGVLIGIFVVVMSLVLWNAGLMGSLRRYGEIGLRLAMGEPRGHIYRAMLIESFVIGVVGSLLGTAAGLAIAFYLQFHGINVSSMMKSASLIMADVLRAQVTPASYGIGFLPGLLATFLGTSVSGIGIYKRQTSQLAKELEA